MRPVTITAGGSQGIAVHQKALSVPANEEHVLRHGLKSVLAHLGNIPMAREAEGRPLDLVHRARKGLDMSQLGLELSGIPAMAVRALDASPGVDTFQETHPHIGVAHEPVRQTQARRRASSVASRQGSQSRAEARHQRDQEKDEKEERKAHGYGSSGECLLFGPDRQGQNRQRPHQ